jgi:Peptidase A4 family
MVQQSDDVKALCDKTDRQMRFYDPLPEGFDPSNAAPAVWERYGIPPRPDVMTFPELATFWDEMFKPRPRFTAPTFELLEAARADRSGTSPSPGTEFSGNWAGAYIAPRDGRQFTEIHGQWVVPEVTAPSGTVGTPELRSSTWIGLDGQRRYFDSTLPQVGTAQFLNSSVDRPYSAWWQWWMRDNPETFYPCVTTLPVKPGHRIMASLRVLDEKQVHVLIANRSTGEMYPPFRIDAPTGRARRQAKVTGATAEWIVERPADPVTGPFGLPDFGQVTFEVCFAISARLSPGGGPGPGRLETLDGARLISMYKVERAPSRRVTIAKPMRLKDDGLRTTFVNDGARTYRPPSHR